MVDPARPQPEPSHPASVLELIQRKNGEAPKVLLRDSPSEHGGTPILDAGSPDARQVPAGRGNYEFHGEIARGGMGVILKGHDRDLGRDVAVKVLKKDLSARPEIVARFVEEAQIGGQLQHPGIVPVYELGLLADERPYFTMKLVKGRTLAALLTERSAPDADRHRFLGIFEQVCQTMAYAHSKGVIHRDLKPANVMVGAFGEVQVLDWGLAKVLAQGGVADEKRERERERTTHATIISTLRHQPGSAGSDSLAGSVMGTPAYMPPEQARGEIERMDERSDVFSLGAILTEILTGRAVYGGEPDELMTQAANAELQAATKRLDECGADADLVALAKKCLAPAPAARPRNAGVLAKELAAWRGSVDERARAAQIAAAEARVKADDERRARRLTLSLAATIVVAIVGGGGAWAAWNAKQQKWREQTQLWQAQTEQRVNAALADATLARGRKEWNAALVAMDQARTLVDAGQPSDELRQRVQAQTQLIATEAAAAGKQAELEQQNRDLLVQLQKLRAPDAYDASGGEQIDIAYLDTFSAYGLPIDDWSVDEAAHALVERGLAEPAAMALDAWADARRRMKHDEDAERLLQIALKADPDPVRTRLRRAILIGDRSLLREFSHEEDLAKLPASSLTLLATAFQKAAAGKDALRVLEVAQLHHPDDYVVNFNLGRLYGVQDGWAPRFEEMVRCFQAALTAQPEDAQLKGRIGLLRLAWLGDPERGLALIEEAARADRNDAEIQRFLGIAYDLRGDYEKSLAAYRESARLRPDDPSKQDNLATALFSLGDFAAEVAVSREFVRLAPAEENGHASLGWALVDAGDVDGARAELQTALRFGGTQLTTLFLDAEVRAASGDHAGAKRTLQKAAANTNPNDPISLLMTCETITGFRDPAARDGAQAVLLAQRVVEIAPRSPRGWRAVGAAHYLAGAWQDCLDAEQRALQIAGSGFALPWYFLAMASERLSEHDAARDWLQQADGWMDERHCKNPELVRLRAEADALIGAASAPAGGR